MNSLTCDSCDFESYSRCMNCEDHNKHTSLETTPDPKAFQPGDKVELLPLKKSGTIILQYLSGDENIPGNVVVEIEGEKILANSWQCRRER